MKGSIESRKEQKTSKDGYPNEVRLETGDTLEVRQAEAAPANGNDDAKLVYEKLEEEGGNGDLASGKLLEWILKRENMLTAYERVVGNKGSHGIDKMTVDQLKGYVKEN